MRAAIIGIIGLLGSFGHAGAEPLLEGRVRLDSGQPVPGARVLLFDLTDLRAAPLAATTDGSGRFTLPLATLAGVLPERFELGVNYPNPFNPSTLIPYQLPTSMHVRLEVFNILGQRVTALVDGEQPAGFHTASWDATDAAGQAVGAGVYLYRLSGDGVQATRSMLLIDGQAGIPLGRGASTGSGGEAAREAGQKAPVYGLTVSGPGLVPYVDPAFRVTAGLAPLDLVLEAPGRGPSAKAATEGRILGDVDNTGGVDFFDALLVALYSQDASVVMPNHGDISLGDVNADGQVDLSDAWAIAAWLNDPSDPALPAGIGEPVAADASLSPDPATVAFLDDGSWHRFTVQAGEPVSVVVNPEGTPPRLEITTRSGRGNFCPPEADDDVAREDGQAVYLSGCSTGPATAELRRESDGTVLGAYTFEVTASPADLVVSVSVSDSTLTPGQSFLLSAAVHNQGTGPSAATTLRYYRSSNRTITPRDTRIGTDAVGPLVAAGTGAESIRLTAPSSEGTWYYGACVVRVSGESGGNNCSAGVRVRVDAAGPSTGPAGDRVALVTLYQATDGPNWTDNTNWLSDRPLGEWKGVTTDSNGRVTTLGLSHNNLQGPIPVELAGLTKLSHLNLYGNQLLTGEIPTELANLANLTYLSLGWNQLTGTIPIELAGLVNLTYLNIRQNQLTGTIPIELARLTKLTQLDIGINQLTGAIPIELARLTKLTQLDIGGNQLTGGILPELGQLSELESLGLSHNQLTGRIVPELGQLTNLRSLYLSSNQLTGSIPQELAQLTKLEELSLGFNQLTGTIPPELGQLTNLRDLYLSSNQLTGTIPPQLGQLTSLTDLYLDQNRLTGTIPPQFGQLSNLTRLELYRNVLSGTIPPQLGQLTNLRKLWLHSNVLTGAIPPELGQLSEITELYLNANVLTDAIPSELGQLSKLEELELQYNQLAGSIPPELGQLTNLKVLILAGNQLTGAIPPELGQLTKLATLGFDDNDGLSGPLPVEFTSLPLEIFGIRGTSVCVPRAVEVQEWLGGIELVFPYTHCRDPQWDALASLYDRTDGPNWKNKTDWLSSAPPGEWYGVTTDNRGRVTGLDLEDNNLSGTLSTALGGLANLKRLNLSSNAALSGPLPHGLTRLSLDALRLDGTQVCTPPQSDFQAWINGISSRTGAALCADTRVDYYALVALYNSTDGPNWTDKTGWLSAAPLDEWHGVTTDAGGRVTELNLRHNKLRGPVVPELGQLEDLRSLDLASNSPDAGRNELTGEIPPELGQLASLSNLDLLGNRLDGEIPSELGQLANLSTLNLGQNELTGEIPPELGRLSSLSHLELSGNPLKGAIPPELGQLTNLETLEIWYSQLTGTIPRELGGLSNLRVLALADNFSLTGEIPPELGQLGNLEVLLAHQQRPDGRDPLRTGAVDQSPESGALAEPADR